MLVYNNHNRTRQHISLEKEKPLLNSASGRLKLKTKIIIKYPFQLLSFSLSHFRGLSAPVV